MLWPMAPLRFGILGAAAIAPNALVKPAATSSGAEVLAVAARDRTRAEAFAAKHRVPRVHDTYEALLADPEVDAVYNPLPNGLHGRWTIAALEAGKHVLVEKPMAMSAVEVEQLFTKAREVGRFAMEAMWMRFNPLHAGLRDRIFDGLLGEVTSVRAGFGTPFHPRGDKVVPADGGSILLDRGIYPVTLAHWFLGEPLAIRASGTLQNGVDIAGHAMLEYPEGRFAQLAWSGVEFLELSASVSGERGWVVLDPMFWAGSTARVHAGTYERIFRTPEVVDHPREGNGFRPMIRAVVEAVDAGLLEHPWQRRDDTLAVARTMDRVLHEIQ